MNIQQKQYRLKIFLQENQYILPSYQLYGGSSGFQDYGILGTILKTKFLQLWRSYFVNDIDEVYEIETPNIMCYDILKASGHVDRFTDFIVYDDKGACYRADHLAKKWFNDNGLQNMVDQVDTWEKQKLEFNINKYKMILGPYDENYKRHLPVTVNTKNLMFEVAPVTIGQNNKVDFLRPEIAQGIVLNYRFCQQFLQKESSFGIAQIGKSYRKEISPQPFTRMREFNQAEIEYFCDPLNKVHPRFSEIKDTIIPILTQDMQNKNIKIPLETAVIDALKNKQINNELIAYYLAKIYNFVLQIGLHKDKIRFRQHLSHEMAHYATECWDLETYVNNDWLECIGCADRGSYDLQSHSINLTNPLKAKRLLQTPIVHNVLKARLDMKLIGQRYKELTSKITAYFNQLSQSDLQNLKETMFKENDAMYICIDQNICVLTKEMIRIDEDSYTMNYEEYYPHIIEPSFGVDRIIFSILEQNFWFRPEDNQRIVLSLPSKLVPYDVAIFQLSKNDQLQVKTNSIINSLRQTGFKCYQDNSSVNIGKKYVRSDEIGIKYAITVDFESLKDNQMTIRDRDTMKQIRVDYDTLVEKLSLLLSK